MQNFVELPLKLEDQHFDLKYDQNALQGLVEEFDMFLEDLSFMNCPEFYQKAILPYELKANNMIEGYNENIENIVRLMENLRVRKNIDVQELTRIKNMIKGLRHIANQDQINEKNLSKLYNLLSKDILDPEDQLDGLYRQNDVFIYYSKDITVPPDKGVEPQYIKPAMDSLFEYINDNVELCNIEGFIKSQIMHYYLVYVHPYYDVNGRTARLLALWYLNNCSEYIYTIFNRGISNNKKEYYLVIREVKKYNRLTFFLKYMLTQTKIELEKEFILHHIDNSINDTLTPLERETILYLLSSKGNQNILTFTDIFNNYNERVKPKFVHENLITPLIDKDVILVKQNYSKKVTYDQPNYGFILNPEHINNDPQKIRRLILPNN